MINKQVQIWISRLKRKWRYYWQQELDEYDEPPDSPPSPKTIERWERDPTEFGFATMYCSECIGNDLCTHHQGAKDRFNEYKIKDE